MLQKQLITISEFLKFANAHQNAEKLLELVNGEIVEKRGGFASSVVAAGICAFITEYNLRYKTGRVTSASATYVMSDSDAFIPSVAYISHIRMPERPPRECPIPPDFAVEVKSPTDTKRAMRRKAEKYLAVGTRLVWLVFPDDRQVEIYSTHEEDSRIMGISDILNGEDVLPDFKLAVKDIFPA